MTFLEVDCYIIVLRCGEIESNFAHIKEFNFNNDEGSLPLIWMLNGPLLLSVEI